MFQTRANDHLIRKLLVSLSHSLSLSVCVFLSGHTEPSLSSTRFRRQYLQVSCLRAPLRRLGALRALFIVSVELTFPDDFGQLRRWFEEFRQAVLAFQVFEEVDE